MATSCFPIQYYKVKKGGYLTQMLQFYSYKSDSANLVLFNQCIGMEHKPVEIKQNNFAKIQLLCTQKIIKIVDK